ncbi:unnamed protein product [Clonostachys chloroleuca]|uniref:Uncharacterized protein n=1 Tax=Clonostachys chloroleuca TaxID=1926264 RepID=A0AA35QGB0_9HYPO|nr:unnamed protein product [Clonostachys chloroleuca]
MTSPAIRPPCSLPYSQVSSYCLKGIDQKDSYILINSTIIEDDDLTFDAFLIAFLFLPETYLRLYKTGKPRNFIALPVIRNIPPNIPKNLQLQSESDGILPSQLSSSLLSLLSPFLGFTWFFLYTLLFTFLSGFDYNFKRTYHISHSELVIQDPVHPPEK